MRSRSLGTKPSSSRLLLVVLSLVLLGASPTSGLPELSVAPIPLPEGAAGLDQIGRLTLWGGLVLNDSSSGFGGFSAVEVSPDGSQLWALSDQGRVLTGRLRYDDDGRLQGLDRTALVPLLDTDGRPVAGARRDAEGLARLPDGSFVISYERRHRLALHGVGLSDTTAIQLAAPQDLQRLHSNRGIEAVTFLSDGRLLMLGETGLRGEVAAFPGWFSGSNGWLRFAYLAARGYRPTGAATLPTGDVVVIERRDPVLILTGGRVVLVPREAIRSGQSVGGMELGRLGLPSLNANYDGIAAWQDGLGRLRLLVISDNNFLSVQRTLLLQFVLE